MTSKVLAVAGLTMGLALALTNPTAAAVPAAGTSAQTALPSATVTQAAVIRDLTLRSPCFDPGGTGTGCSGGSIRVSIAVRGWYTSSTATTPYKVDAAARGYDLGNTFVGNVQVENVTLLDSNIAIKSGPSGLSNTDGGTSTALITVPGCSVAAGTGQFTAQVTATWRNAGTLEREVVRAGFTPASFRTTGCTG